MNWRIELTEASGEMPIVTVLQAHRIWKRLSTAAQDAVVAAYPDGTVAAHPHTLTALNRHGFTHCGMHTNFTVVLTDAGKAVARWGVPVKP